jgi:hypothetical protein
MKTKAQVHAAAKAKVKKVFAAYLKAEEALKAAKTALGRAHAEHIEKTGFRFMELENRRAFEKRVGPKEVARLKCLAECHELADKMQQENADLGREEARNRAWKQLGWNADCTKKLKGRK